MAWLEWLDIGSRFVLGAQLAFAGLNGFFHWIPIPPSSPVIDQFSKAMIDSKFIMPLVKICEITFGLLLVAGLFVPLSLIVLGPIVLLITGLHLWHNEKPWGVCLPITLPYLIALALNFDSLRFLFVP